MITGPIRTLITDFPLGFIATVTPEGKPAVSPKGTFRVLDETHIGFADIRSPGTMRNLAANPWCEVNFIDILKRKGARVAGDVQIHAKGTEGFETHLPGWQAQWPDLAHRMRAFVVIEVASASVYSTPPYDDGATEEEMVALYKSKFAGMYALS